jgi:flagellar motility protein MotE (MotC chaperone)
MKWLLIALLALTSFCGTLAGILAATGKLNAESLGVLMGGAPPAAAEAHGETKAAAGAPELRILQEKEAEIARREKLLEQKEAELATREQGLEKLRQSIASMQSSLQSDLAAKEAERETKITTAVSTISVMEAERAAQALASFSIEEQAEILKRIAKDKDRAAIVEAMTPEQAGRVLKELSTR